MLNNRYFYLLVWPVRYSDEEMHFGLLLPYLYRKSDTQAQLSLQAMYKLPYMNG